MGLTSNVDCLPQHISCNIHVYPAMCVFVDREREIEQLGMRNSHHTHSHTQTHTHTHTHVSCAAHTTDEIREK